MEFCWRKQLTITLRAWIGRPSSAFSCVKEVFRLELLLKLVLKGVRWPVFSKCSSERCYSRHRGGNLGSVRGGSLAGVRVGGGGGHGWWAAGEQSQPKQTGRDTPSLLNYKARCPLKKEKKGDWGQKERVLVSNELPQIVVHNTPWLCLSFFTT